MLTGPSSSFSEDYDQLRPGNSDPTLCSQECMDDLRQAGKDGAADESLSVFSGFSELVCIALHSPEHTTELAGGRKDEARNMSLSYVQTTSAPPHHPQQTTMISYSEELAEGLEATQMYQVKPWLRSRYSTQVIPERGSSNRRK